MSILLRIAYDGTAFSGWARQKARPDGTPIRTVQGELEDALSRLFGEAIPLRGASRTDAGVHALGQLASFEPPKAIPARGVLEALAGRLADDVTVLAAWEEPGTVDVRGGNDGKLYRYRIRTTRSRDPVGGCDEWHYARALDRDAMAIAAQAFAGTHDFGAFRSAHCQASSSTRTMRSVTLRGESCRLGPLTDPGRFDDAPTTDDNAQRVVIEVDGQAFLHNMVRIIVGTLVEVGAHRRSADSIAEVLRSGDRRLAGMTAPASGLTLVEVRWPYAGASASGTT